METPKQQITQLITNEMNRLKKMIEELTEELRKQETLLRSINNAQLAIPAYSPQENGKGLPVPYISAIQELFNDKKVELPLGEAALIIIKKYNITNKDQIRKIKKSIKGGIINYTTRGFLKKRKDTSKPKGEFLYSLGKGW